MNWLFLFFFLYIWLWNFSSWYESSNESYSRILRSTAEEIKKRTILELNELSKHWGGKVISSLSTFFISQLQFTIPKKYFAIQCSGIFQKINSSTSLQFDQVQPDYHQQEVDTYREDRLKLFRAIFECTFYGTHDHSHILCHLLSQIFSNNRILPEVRDKSCSYHLRSLKKRRFKVLRTINPSEKFKLKMVPLKFTWKGIIFFDRFDKPFGSFSLWSWIIIK